MTSEIRVNKLTNRIGLSTVTFADSGIGMTVTGRIDPDTDSARDLGTTSVRWRNVYADTLYGDGSNLTGITGTTINNNADNRVITGSGSANTLNGESNLTFDGDNIILSGNDGRRFSFAGGGTSHYMKYDNTLGGIILNGYGGIAFETNGTNERLRINSSGTAQFKGNIEVDAGGSGMIDFGDITTAYGRLYADNPNGVMIGSKSNHNLILRTNNTERLRIGTSGQIGISGANYGTSGQVLTSQGSGSAPTWASVSSPLSNRNLIINGAMLVDQRGDYSTNNSNLSRQYGGPDRFHQYYYQSDESARYTFKQGGSGVSPVDKGFSRTAILDVTTQQTTVTAGQAIWTSQRIEANNASHLKYGHSDAESVTLSFWIKSSVTGIYTIMLNHTNMDERYITTYTVNVADTWEKKTITFPGDTRSGKTIAATNGYGLEVKWVWMAGSSRVATPNQWATQGNVYGASGVTLANIFSSASNNLYLTGVQLEIGTTATPFEHIPFADELARCQRYFVKFAGGSDAYCFPAKGQGGSSCDIGIPLPTALRAQPSITLSNHRYFSSHSGGFSSSTNTPSVIHYNSPSGTTGSPMISLNAGGHSSSNNATGTFTPQGSSLSIDAEL